MSDETEATDADRTPEEIEAEIERTREELGETVEALAAKTDVKARAKEKVDETKERLGEKLGGISDQAREASPDSAAQGAEQAAAAVKAHPDYVTFAGAFVAGVVAGWILRG